jgi:phosphatidylinositol glycan class M
MSNRQQFAIYATAAFSALIHAALIMYGEWQDKHMRVAYTDIDYWVYSDAAAHVYNGRSAFDRHTYRYTPLLAWLLVPNEIIGGWWGKALFSAAGVLSGILIYRLTNKSIVYSSLWLFSPLTVNISTRGSSDSLIILLVLLVFHEMKANRIVSAAIWYGISVHFRIFPIFFAIPIMMHLGSAKRIFKFGILSGSVCLGLVALFYLQDGYRFIYEAYLYHFVRKDHRHNFSLFYYAIYLASSADSGSLLSKILTFSGFIPQVGSLVFVGIRFGRKNFMFAIFLQTVIFVAFNKVITAQYFLWYFGLLPVALYYVLETSPNKSSTIVQILIAVVCWGVAEVLWLRASYGLEVEGRHNYLELLTASTLLFIAHIGLCAVFITAYIRANRGPVVASKEKPEEFKPRRSRRIGSKEPDRTRSQDPPIAVRNRRNVATSAAQ